MIQDGKVQHAKIPRDEFGDCTAEGFADILIADFNTIHSKWLDVMDDREALGWKLGPISHAKHVVNINDPAWKVKGPMLYRALFAIYRFLRTNDLSHLHAFPQLLSDEAIQNVGYGYTQIRTAIFMFWGATNEAPPNPNPKPKPKPNPSCSGGPPTRSSSTRSTSGRT